MASAFSDAERDAMKDRARELAASKGVRGAAKVEKELQMAFDAIAEMSDSDRALAEQVHRIVLEAAPQLTTKTFYGGPAYALDGKVLMFFQASGKFGARYSTIGFTEDAKLDDGGMWLTSWAVSSISDADAQQIATLIAKAAG